MSNARRFSAWLVVALLLVAVPTAFAQVTPSVTVSDQAIENDTVTVDEVVSDGPGWIVIHADQGGSPGPVIGHAAVQDGTNADVMVEIDTASATETLYAMLHMDAGETGTYEFPGADGPVSVDGQVVAPAFTVTGTGQAQETPTAEAAETPMAEATATPETPETLPETGGGTPWTPILLVGFGLLVIIVGALLWRSRQTENIRYDE